MDSNVSLYPFDPERDEYFAYELRSRELGRRKVDRHSPEPPPGQIRFEAPCVAIPDALARHKHISIEELEIELERSAREQER